MAYSARTDIEAHFGKSNVKTWADLDNDGVIASITARIAAAIVYADNVIDTRLRGGPYDIPFATTPTLITHVSAKLAGVWLYESRGVTDFDSTTGRPQHQLHWHKMDALKTLMGLRSCRIRLDLDMSTIVPEVLES